MIQTTVKLLNGELLTVEHNPGMILLKQAIQQVYPEMYEECQVLTPLENENIFLLTVDTVENAITIELEKDIDVVINTHPNRIQNFDINEFVNYIEHYSDHSFIWNDPNVFRAHSVGIGCKSIHNSGIGYFLHPIFHPIKGFTSVDMMHIGTVESYTDDGIRENWYVPMEEEVKKIWFPTFRELVDALKDHVKFPVLYKNNVFLDKVDSAFREYANSF